MDAAMNPQDEVTAFLKAHPDTKHLDAAFIDLNGKAFGKRYPANEIEKLFLEGSTMCAAMQFTDVRGDCWDTCGLGFSDGDPDGACRPIPGSLVPVPWAEEGRAQCLMRFDTLEEGGRVWFEPRHILEGVVERFQALGLRPVTAVELEFYLIDRERGDGGAPQPPRSPVTGKRQTSGHVFNLASVEEFDGVLSAIQEACLAQKLPVTTLSKEFGPGQFEINLEHGDDPLRAADQAAMLRHAVTATARARGFDATFMSKPYGAEAGSGLQINLSLLDKAGANIFDPRLDQDGKTLGAVVAGMQALLAESLLLYAPSFHSYRRFEPNQFTPVSLDWGENNRSVAFRVPESAPENRRVEHRAAGAEANPYLVMAGVLAAAHHGLTQGLEPSRPGSGNVGEEADPELPLTFWAAMDRFRAGKTLSDYLGARYVEAYAHAKQAEFESFFSEMQPREYDWYL